LKRRETPIDHSTPKGDLAMNRRPIRLLMHATCATLVAASAVAQTPQSETVQMQPRTQTQERIYGSELMSEQERNEYRKRMSETKTEQEREQLRKEQHERMNDRAKQRGMTLPDEPRAMSQGQTPRQSQGSGLSPGAGGRPGGGAGGGSGGGSGGKGR
jgi:uncharacterized membrane protein YgcG